MRRWLTHGSIGLMLAVSTLILGGATAAHADPRDFALINGSGTTIDQVYVSPSNQTDWGEDILGRDVLEAGQTVVISFQRFTPGDCLYDVRVVTAEGAEGVLSQVDLCETTDLTFTG